MTSRSLAGRQARAAGASWESVVEVLLAIGEQQGRWTWWRIPEPVRRLGAPDAHGRFLACASSEGPPDYVVLAHGLAVACEAKQTSLGRWAYHDLREHQARALDAWEAQGGRGCVLLFLAGSRWCLPWRALGVLWHRWREGTASCGEASLTPEAARQIGIEIDAGGEWVGRMSA